MIIISLSNVTKRRGATVERTKKGGPLGKDRGVPGKTSGFRGTTKRESLAKKIRENSGQGGGGHSRNQEKDSKSVERCAHPVSRKVGHL